MAPRRQDVCLPGTTHCGRCPSPMTDLRLIALDEEDLAVVSTHLQDAVLKAGDMAWQPRSKRFAAVVNRFDWAAAAGVGRSRARKQRRRSALRFEKVTSARLLGIEPKAKDRVLALLAIQFEAAAAPAGRVTLHFSGGAAIQLEVECIEAELRDLGGAWSTRNIPDHFPEDRDED